MQRSGHGRPGARVEDASDLGRLDVELADIGEELASAALSDAGLGEVREGYAWLDVDALRAAAVSQSGASSGTAFDDMVRYAASRGWVSPDGRAVRAHCVPAGGEDSPPTS